MRSLYLGVSFQGPSIWAPHPLLRQWIAWSMASAGKIKLQNSENTLYRPLHGLQDVVASILPYV